jgi:hypothetical protein
VTEALWWALSHPGLIAGSDGAGTLVFMAVIVVLITAGFMASIGKRVMPHSSVVAVLMGCAFVPLMMNAIAFAVALSQPSGTDGGGILIFTSLVLSICALPVTIATSLLYFFVQRRRLAA